MLGTTARWLVEQVFVAQQNALALEQERIEAAVSELPKPFLEEDDGSIGHPIVLGEHKKRRKAARGR